MSLDGKTAVVFGGAGGIGVEICKLLLKRGVSKLAILDLTEPKANIKTEINSCGKGAKVIFERCDITDKKNVEDVVRNKVVSALGTFDIFVNAAGIAGNPDPDKVIAVNLTGLINNSILALSIMSKEKSGGRGGTIVNIASIVGLRPTAHLSVYAASKFGVVGFTRSLGADPIFKHTGVRFITICPGVTETTLLPKFSHQSDVLYSWMSDEIAQLMDRLPAQGPSVVGECIVQAILDGENGSVWLCEGGKINKLEIPVAIPK